MLQTSVTINNNNVLVLPLPEQYKGKDIEVLIYSKDELTETPQKQPALMGSFAGTISKEDAAQLRIHTEQARDEWDRDF